MMNELHFLDHNLPLTFKDLHELQLHSQHVQKQKIEIISMDLIPIWTDVDAILSQSRKPNVKPHEGQCVEAMNQSNEIERSLNVDLLDVSFNSNESFDSLSLSPSNVADTTGKKQINKLKSPDILTKRLPFRWCRYAKNSRRKNHDSLHQLQSVI